MFGKKRKKNFKKVKLGTKNYSKKRKRNKNLLGRGKFFLIFSVFFVIIPISIFGMRFYNNVWTDLPSMSKIKNLNLSQTSTITDRNGEVLYKMYKQNREYVGLDEIAENMQNAIIATEDSHFWENPGIDIFGIARAAIHDIGIIAFNKNGSIQGASTLTQQLIKNVLLTSERTIDRKFKEIVLALKLDNYIKDNIKNNYNNIPQKELENKVKENILEIYLNYIFLGNNSYGVEAASQKYFNKSAKELNILESSILASLPKAPSKYNPYKNKGLLMGEIDIKDSNGKKISPDKSFKDEVISKIASNIENSDISNYNNTSSLLNFLHGLLSFNINYQDTEYTVNYSFGRQNIVLMRMFEESYISKKEFKENFTKALKYEFQKNNSEIKAPHFVFYIMDLLKDKYKKETLMKGGLTIKTSLDYNIQKLAKNSIDSHTGHLEKKGANNAAMVYLNSENGNILSYVGSRDYNNKEIDGQVDILTSERQPGSSIKPFVYSLGFKNNKLTPDSPIYDIPFKVNDYEPQNFDGKFLGLLPIKEALAYSRNIPAIKMLISAGGERKFTDFLQKLGINSVKQSRDYGYSMAIGTSEMKPLELANAYSHLSRLGKPAETNPILEIRGPDGSIIYKKQKEQQEQIIPSGVAYLIWSILSNKGNFPSNWFNTYNYDGIKFGTKSGTTNVKLKNDKKLPRDGWLATYTPSKVALFWAGNTKGEPMKEGTFGGSLNSPIWKDFISKLENRGLIRNNDMQEIGVKNISISKISGKIASYNTPLDFISDTVAYLGNIPQENDNSVNKIKIDKLCNGKISAQTPKKDIETAYVIDPNILVSNEQDINEVEKWWKEKGIDKYSKELKKTVLIEEPSQECKSRELVKEKGKINIELLKPKDNTELTRKSSIWMNVKSSFNIKNITIKIDDLKLNEYSYNQKSISTIKNISLPKHLEIGKNYTLTVLSKDEIGFEDKKEIDFKLIENDNDSPFIVKDKSQITKTENGYNVTLLFKDNTSQIKNIRIFQNDELIKNFNKNIVNFNVENNKNLSFKVTDSYGNTKQGKINLK